MDPKPLTVGVALVFLGALGGYAQRGLGPQAGRFQGRGAFWAGSEGATPTISTGCERRIVCWEPLLLVEWPAQAARTDNPTVMHLSCGCWDCTFSAQLPGEAAPLEGGLGG